MKSQTSVFYVVDSVENRDSDDVSDEVDDVDQDRFHLILPGESDFQTRQTVKEEKKDRRKQKNKKIRKRIRRVLRNSWKFLRRGCAGLAPTTVGMGIVLGNIVSSFSTNSAPKK